MSVANNRVVIKGRSHHKNADALAADVLPGMDCDLDGNGKIRPNSRTLLESVKTDLFRIPKENALSGGALNSAAPLAGEDIAYYIPTTGDEVNLRIKVGEVLVVGDSIIPEGGGTGMFIKAAGTESAYGFRCLEALTSAAGNEFAICEKN
jgi:hypothetical protein